MRRSTRLVAVACGLSLVVAAACGGDDDDDDTAETEAPTETSAPTETDAPATTTGDTEAPGTTAGGEAPASTAEGEAPAGDVAMTVTVNLNPDAVWQDGTPITVADLECSWRAALNTPASILTAGHDKITAIREGESDKQAIIEFSEVYGPYKTLLDRIIQADSVENCDDISGDFQTEMPLSARAYMIESWSESQLVAVPNPNYYGDAPVTETVVMVPQTDQDTEVASILSGQVDFIYPQYGDSIGNATRDDPNLELSVNSGGDYEGFYFQQLEGPFADPVYREAFSKSIDRESLFQQIYAPIYASAGAEGELLNCGPIVQGPYCPEDTFQNTYDPAAAEALMTEDGWTKNGEGLWEKDGTVPQVRWMINTGNLRRENTQAFLIPLLRTAGFDVVADNGTAEEVFQQRLPGLDYDLAMYISTAPPDPQYLTPSFICSQIPTEENNFQGQNTQGWCNEEASAMLEEADRTTDEAARIELVHNAIRLMEEDFVMLPLANYPKVGIWRTDAVGGPVDGELANYKAFINFDQWEDVNGDGQIVIGAEQWPGCLNPVTECANSSWSVWTATFPYLPSIWDTTNDQTFEITELVTEEPTVEVAG
jgi:peptide/nickel transport system substrate-binding protein